MKKGKKEKVARFGVSLEEGLLSELDRIVRLNKFSNRSQAIRNIVRENIVKSEWMDSRETAGTITLVYDHTKRELMTRLTHVQHHHHDMIISSQHIHLDHDNCMEVLIIKGRPQEAQKLLAAMRSIKGVKYGALSMATMAGRLP